MNQARAAAIRKVSAREILNSRGDPTLEVEIVLTDDTRGSASVPSGASTGRHEAHELRDGDPTRFAGKGVERAVANVVNDIAACIRGEPATEQARIDRLLVELDGSSNLARLGANAILATSLAVCRAGAAHTRQPLYRHLGSLAGCAAPSLPLPMVNILSGGAHASSGMDLQDFLAVPVGAISYRQALQWVAQVRAAAEGVMREQGLTTLWALEGGLSPGLPRIDSALDLMLRAIEAAKLRPGEDVAIALDVAASELYRGGVYELPVEGLRVSSPEMIALLVDRAQRYPIVSIEDGLDQDDWPQWTALTAALPALQLVGDDLFVTNPARIARGIDQRAANGVLIKLNQNGTLSGTLQAIALARHAGYATVISARSGETEDSFIADLAVGTGAGQIKIGSVRGSERLTKYNQLLRIEDDSQIGYAGITGLAGNCAGVSTVGARHARDPSR